MSNEPQNMIKWQRKTGLEAFILYELMQAEQLTQSFLVKSDAIKAYRSSSHLHKELNQPRLLSGPPTKPKQPAGCDLPAAPTQRLNLTLESPGSLFSS